MNKPLALALSLALAPALLIGNAQAATIVPVNMDPAGQGLNDPTPAAPVGGLRGDQCAHAVLRHLGHHARAGRVAAQGLAGFGLVARRAPATRGRDAGRCRACGIAQLPDFGGRGCAQASGGGVDGNLHAGEVAGRGVVGGGRFGGGGRGGKRKAGRQQGQPQGAGVHRDVFLGQGDLNHRTRGGAVRRGDDSCGSTRDTRTGSPSAPEASLLPPRARLQRTDRGFLRSCDERHARCFVCATCPTIKRGNARLLRHAPACGAAMQRRSLRPRRPRSSAAPRRR